MTVTQKFCIADVGIVLAQKNRKICKVKPKEEAIKRFLDIRHIRNKPNKSSSLRLIVCRNKILFQPRRTFDIYAKDSTSKCGAYSYKIWKDEIRVIEYDMVMGFEILSQLLTA